MSEPIPVAHREPSSSGRLPILMSILVALILVLTIPYISYQWHYAAKQGELQAKSEAAAAEISQLSEGQKLVSLDDTSRALRAVAQRIEPSVVHINTEQVKVVREDQLDEWGSRIPYRRGQRMRGQGSGVVIDKDQGYIVTNYHVIQDATALNVDLADGRTIVDVRVVGYDVFTDLAVLKIGTDRLIAAQWGDSDKLEVGDWVLAVGNPYGLDRTVTFGILSAKDRRGLKEGSPYQVFLQSDAAVNPGNSGGPLLNIRGEVIGINTAIVGPAYQGISFAIPSNTARQVVTQLISEGSVARGWLGVGLDNVDADAAAQLGMTSPTDVIVTRIVPGSPAAEAGLRIGDVILKWAGKPVTDATEFTLEIARTAVDRQVEAEILRGGRVAKVTVTIRRRPQEMQMRR